MGLLTATSNFLFLKINTTYISIGRSQVAEDTTFNCTLNTNQWYHVAFTRSGSNIYGYLNGVLQVSTTNTNSYATGPMSIGADSGTGQVFTGYISNLRYSTSAIYTSAFTPSTTPLVADTSTAFLSLQDSILTDASNNRYIVSTATGSPTVVPFSPFATNSLTSTTGGLVTPSTISGSFFIGSASDYLMIAHNTVYDLSTGMPWTFDCWAFSTGSASAYRTIIAKRNAGQQWEFYIQITTGYFGFYNGTQYVTNIVINSNMWYHLAASYDGTNLRLFVNGVQGYSGAVNAIAGTDNIYIGAAYFSSTAQESFIGYLSESTINDLGYDLDELYRQSNDKYDE